MTSESLKFIDATAAAFALLLALACLVGCAGDPHAGVFPPGKAALLLNLRQTLAGPERLP